MNGDKLKKILLYGALTRGFNGDVNTYVFKFESIYDVGFVFGKSLEFVIFQAEEIINRQIIPFIKEDVA